MDCSPPGSSVLGILQARILEWAVIPSFKGSSWLRDHTLISCISCIGRQILNHWATWGALGVCTLLTHLWRWIFFSLNKTFCLQSLDKQGCVLKKFPKSLPMILTEAKLLGCTLCWLQDYTMDSVFPRWNYCLIAGPPKGRISVWVTWKIMWTPWSASLCVWGNLVNKGWSFLGILVFSIDLLPMIYFPWHCWIED